jgi:uncharacterized protein with PIN domain
MKGHNSLALYLQNRQISFFTEEDSITAENNAEGHVLMEGDTELLRRMSHIHIFTNYIQKGGVTQKIKQAVRRIGGKQYLFKFVKSITGRVYEKGGTGFHVFYVCSDFCGICR